jgi:hypothetical protein
VNNRSFITTQSVKKLKKHLKEWTLDPAGWSVDGDHRTYNLSELIRYERTEENQNRRPSQEIMECVFYKERWIHEDGLTQKLIVTYSLKYSLYQKQIRARQVDRAEKLLRAGNAKIEKKSQNDYRRFIAKDSSTANGEPANSTSYRINQDVIDSEALYDGFYAVCTNLEDRTPDIIKINKGRWEIEESFRIMKCYFKARPVFLSRDDRIKAHFTTCFISLLIYRLLEKKLHERYSCDQIISELQNMNFLRLNKEGFTPTYTRTDFTDDLHASFGFRTDFQFVDIKNLRRILRSSKS